MNRIKLSLYLKRNKETILRNVFFNYVNSNKDINQQIKDTKERIRESVIKYNDMDCDVSLTESLNNLEKYIIENVFNYSELKRIFKNDIKITISPKETYKQYLNNNLNNSYYIDCLIKAV